MNWGVQGFNPPPTIPTLSFRRLLKTRLISDIQRVRGIALFDALYKLMTYLFTSAFNFEIEVLSSEFCNSD